LGFQDVLLRAIDEGWECCRREALRIAVVVVLVLVPVYPDLDAAFGLGVLRI
jgi:hypothetical protein